MADDVDDDEMQFFIFKLHFRSVKVCNRQSSLANLIEGGWGTKHFKRGSTKTTASFRQFPSFYTIITALDMSAAVLTSSANLNK